MKRTSNHLLSLALFGMITVAGCKSAPPPPPPAHAVSVITPMLRNVPVYVDYIGHMVAKTSVQVRAQVSGNIVAQYYVEGSRAKQGDLLVVIDPRPFEANLAKAQATLEQTYANLEYAKDVTYRYAKLVQEDFVSQLNYDQYVTNMVALEAQLNQNKADIETAKINLGYCYITAPMNCITGKLQVKTGNYVDAGANTELTLLNQIQPILVDFWVPETDLLTIQERQQQGTLKLLVYPEPSHKHCFTGELTLIDNQINTGTGAVLLEGTLKNEDGLLWAGHFVDVRLIIGEQKDALLVPNDAVMVGQNGSYAYVVTSDMTIATRNLKIGQRYEDKYISIVSGLNADDQVVTQGQRNLYPGMKVRIEPAEPATPPAPAATSKQ
ncbi:MAG: efflux RND transporter periplasmic adaptor subunit [Chlamydiota bacterium]